MDQTLSGSATLRPMWESPFIRLALDHRGHIAVSGELGDADQHLRFTFDTDQTCLRPLISDLDACLHLPAVQLAPQRTTRVSFGGSASAALRPTPIEFGAAQRGR